MDEVKQAFLAAVARHGFTTRKWNAVRRAGTVTQVLALQRSQYGPSYYLNVGLWPLELAPPEGDVSEVDCPFRTRAEEVTGEFPPSVLDLETPVPDRSSACELVIEKLVAFLDRVTDLDALRRLDAAGRLHGWAVTRSGCVLLDRATSQGAEELSQHELTRRIIIDPPRD